MTEAETTQLCYGAIGRAGGRYVAVEPFRDSVAQSRAATVEPSWFNVMTIWGRKVALGGDYARDASPEDRAFGARAFAAVQKRKKILFSSSSLFLVIDPLTLRSQVALGIVAD